MDFIAVIPARHASARLPGKALADIGGKPMIRHVWERVRDSGARMVIIATDDARILEVCRGFGADCDMTEGRHVSGTDRIAEVAARRGFDARTIIVNVQGDEPFIPVALPGALAECLRAHPAADMATAMAPFTAADEFLDENCVKVVAALDGSALYFSRAPVPWPRTAGSAAAKPGASSALTMADGFAQAWRHIGIYAYRGASLLKFAALTPTPLEQCEKLEQLRALEHGLRIQLLALDRAPPPGVDTPQDLMTARRYWEGLRQTSR